MSVDEVFRKPYDVQTLQAPDSAEGINQNFDAIWWALKKLQDAINAASSSSGSSGSNALLDGSVHTDTEARTPVRGDIIVANSTPKWDRLAAGVANQLLRMGASDPAWATLSSTDFPHNLLSSTHSDTQAAVPALGSLVVGQYTSDPNLAALKCWNGGRNFPGVYNGNDGSAQKFWAGGRAMAMVQTGSGSVVWKRLSQGLPGQILRVGSSGLEWYTSSLGGSTSSRVYRTSDQGLTSGADTTLSFQSVDWDDGGFFSTGSPTRLTIPSAGTYSIVGQVSYPWVIFGLAWTRIFVNGTMRAETQEGLNNVDGTVAPSAGYDTHQVAAILKLNAGDYVELHSWPVRYAGTAAVAKGGQNNTWLSIGRVS